MIEFNCPACSEPISVPESLARQEHDCPTCQRIIRVPGEEALLRNMRNPFRDVIVTDPWRTAEIDVQDINREAFEVCRQAFEAVGGEGRSLSVLLHGEAGSGKTHLMRRLRTYLAGHPSVFVSVQLRTSPQRLWRHIRRQVSDDLFRNGHGDTQFDRWVSVRLSHATGLDYDLATVLQWLTRQGPHPQAHAWLRGDTLPEAELQRLGVPVESDTDDTPEEKACAVVTQLCDLCGSETPVVFCFDQVEAIQEHYGDREALRAFGRVVAGLHDRTHNALIVSCIQSSFFDAMFDSCDSADRDRLASYQVKSLPPLTFDQAAHLAMARMDSLLELRDLRPWHEGRLWPLNEPALKAYLDAVPGRRLPARKVIACCAELFEAARRGAADLPAAPKPPKLGRQETLSFLEYRWERRRTESVESNSPDYTDQILQHGLPLLLDVSTSPWERDGKNVVRDIDMVFACPGKKRLEVSLCNDRNMTSLAGRLRRLVNRAKAESTSDLVFLRDTRLPISERAQKTQQYIDELRQLGVRFVRPSTESLASLDVLRGLLSDARSGDLANDGETIEPKTVAEWVSANMPPPLRQLIHEIFEPNIAEAAPEGLLDLLQERRIIRLDEAAKELAQPVARIEQWARSNAGRIGMLTGPPVVLFRCAPEDKRADTGEAS